MGVVVTPGEALVAGGASLADQFVQVAVDLRPGDCQLTVQSQGDGVPISVGGAYASEWFYLEWVPLPNSDPLAQYAHTVARQMGATFSRSVPVGWSSWYIYFDKVAEVDVRDNLAAAALHADELPIELIQLDQGFEPIWGDWTEHNERFPHSLAALARRIRGSGLTPGLWLAPLTVHPHSELAREHPEWLLRDEGGAPVSAGLFTNPSFTNRFFAQALDPTHPGVEEYLRELITAAVREWGYPYLKLDFLYAGALPGKHHYPRVTRAQAYRRALRIVREAAGEEVFLVGCGAPLGPSIGLVDAMRIGPDTAPHWQPRLAGLSWPFRKDPMMPALRNSLRNVATRAWMHDRWWVNDPDNLMVRSGRTSLTEDEVLAQATLVGLSGGLLVLSDDLGDLSPEARRVAASLLPPLLGGGMDVLDLFRQEMPAEVVTPVPRAWATWQLVGLFNWESKEAELPLPVRLPDFDPGVDYHVVDFWNRRYLPLQRGEALPTFAVSPHGAVLLGLRRVHAPPQLVTTTFHISQGGEVTDWEVGEGEVTLRLELGRIADGEVWLTLPGAPIAATLEGEPLPAGALRAVAPGVWAVAFRLFDQGWLRVRYGEGGEG
jgi:alpha-galactosidase